jgi:plastocyanin
MAMDTSITMVRQQNRTFSVDALRIPVGGAVSFSNQDEFEHEVYVDAPNFAYDSEEQEPGDSATVHFTSAGTFPVRCHIHPKMHLQVEVVGSN